MPASPEYSGNVARFTGFADLYDCYRAEPPTTLAVTVAQFSGVLRPDLVVDLGSGTGLSTRYWAERAERVIGIEPTPDMRLRAEAATTAGNVSYREGFSHATGLPAQCARVVCCQQSLHWMDPHTTFAEVKRLLQPGGVFAACDYDWPPVTPAPEANAAFELCILRGRRLEQELGIESRLRFWDKSGHLSRMQASGIFLNVTEVALNHHDPGNAARLVGLLFSQGYIQTLLKHGCSESDLGIDALRATAERTLGETQRPFKWTARAWIGVV